MVKVIEITVLHVRDEFLSSPSFLTNLRIAIRASTQERVDEISAHLYLLPNLGEFEDFVTEYTAQLNSEANTNTIKTHIIGPMNALIDLKNGHSSKNPMDGISTRSTEHETIV